MANSASHLDLIAQAQASKEVTSNGLSDAASPSMAYGRRQSTCSGLTWGYYGGNVTLSGGTMSQIANGTLTITASATNYIVANKSTGAVSSSTSTTNWNDTASYWRLYSVVVGSATVTSYTDSRELAKYTGSADLASLGAEAKENRDASGGYAGLTLFKINFRNAANTFTSFFTNTNTAARTYTFQNKDGTIADLADVATKQDASAALADFVAAATGVGDALTDVPRNAELGTAAYVDLESVPQNVFPVLVSTARTLTIDDSGKTFVVSGTTTITLPLAAEVFNASVPFNVAVKAITGATVTVARSGSDTIETVAGNKSMTANTGLVFFPTSTTTWETI